MATWRLRFFFSSERRAARSVGMVFVDLSVYLHYKCACVIAVGPPPPPPPPRGRVDLFGCVAIMLLGCCLLPLVLSVLGNA